MEADHGKVTFTRMESDTALYGITANVDFGPDYRDLYDGSGTTDLYVNGNLSSHFPYPAQIWASMWQKHSGQTVDGVIAVDPTALSYLLAVTGPATLPDRSQLTAANAVALTQSTNYARSPGSNARGIAQRKAYQLERASAASKKILAGGGQLTALLRAAGKAAGEPRILIWSAEPAPEAAIAQTSKPMGGIISRTTAPFVGLSIVNEGGSKLDYYLDRCLTWQRTASGSLRRTTVTIKLTNNAPPSGLSPYVTVRNDDRS